MTLLVVMDLEAQLSSHVNPPTVSQRMAVRRHCLHAAVGLGFVISTAACGTAQAACKIPVSAATVDDFLDHPRRYADNFPLGGPAFVAAMRTFAALDRTTLKAVLVLRRTLNDPQKRDLGKGLALAVIACLPRDGEVAREIADALKQSGDTAVIDAYLAASDDGTNTPAQATPADDTDPLANSLSINPGQDLNISPLEGSRLPATGSLLRSQ